MLFLELPPATNIIIVNCKRLFSMTKAIQIEKFISVYPLEIPLKSIWEFNKYSVLVCNGIDHYINRPFVFLSQYAKNSKNLTKMCKIHSIAVSS